MYVSGVWVLNHLPLIDFRPFKVGANIQKEWKFLKVQKSVVEMTFIYNVNGEIQNFRQMI
jgi:hypothetical protein